MKTTTRQAVTAALIDGPKTMRYLLSRTKLSRVTLDNALSQLADRVPGVWPIEYQLVPRPDDPPRGGMADSVPKAKADQVEKAPKADKKMTEIFTPELWNDVMDSLSKRKITKDRGLGIANRQLGDVIRLLETAMVLFDEADGKPDWWTLIGGKDE